MCRLTNYVGYEQIFLDLNERDDQTAHRPDFLCAPVRTGASEMYTTLLISRLRCSAAQSEPNKWSLTD